MINIKLFLKKRGFVKHFNKAVRYANNGDYKTAAKEYEKAIDLYRGYYDYYDTYWGLGQAYREIGKWDKAKDVLLKAITINPMGEKARLHLGIVYHDLGLFNEARDEYLKVIEINPKNKEGYLHLGLIYLKLKDYSASLDAFNRALAIDPTYKRAYCNLALWCEEQNKFKDAVQWYEKALEIKQPPDEYSRDFDIYSYVTACYEKLGLKEKAIEYLNKCASLAKTEEDKNTVKKLKNSVP